LVDYKQLRKQVAYVKGKETRSVSKDLKKILKFTAYASRELGMTSGIFFYQAEFRKIV